MGLYLGSEKLKVYTDNVFYSFNIPSAIPIINGVLLKTSEGYIWKDSNGLYLTAIESVLPTIETTLLKTSDGNAIKDSSGLYLVFKEDY